MSHPSETEIDAVADKLITPEADMALQAFFDRLREKTRSFYDTYGDDDGKVERIEAISRTGYWAWTNGGYTLTVQGLISYAANETHPSTVDFLVTQYNDLDEDALGDEFDMTQAAYDGFYRYEFQAVIYLASNWRNDVEPKIDQITFRGGINPYSPGEQGEKTTWYFEKVVPLADLTPAKVLEVEGLLLAALASERSEDQKAAA